MSVSLPGRIRKCRLSTKFPFPSSQVPIGYRVNIQPIYNPRAIATSRLHQFEESMVKWGQNPNLYLKPSDSGRPHEQMLLIKVELSPRPQLGYRNVSLRLWGR